jgi:ABC-type antimicrobial peptide transport system permease subunit
MALFASLSFAVTQRTPELAVRLAIGATRPSILRLVVGETAVVVIAGVGVGVVASLAVGRLLQNQVYGIATTDRSTLFQISVLLIATAIAAAATPSLRALRTDPSRALRD